MIATSKQNGEKNWNKR